MSIESVFPYSRKALEAAGASAEISWWPPQFVIDEIFRASRREIVFIAMRTIFISLVLVGFVREFLLPQIPEFPAKGLIIVPLLPVMLLLSAMTIRAPCIAFDYAVTALGIIVPSKERPIIRWSDIDSFTREAHPRLQGLDVLLVHLKLGVARSLLLPTDPNDIRAITAAVARHLPERPPLDRYSPISRQQWIFGALLTVIWCCFCAVIPVNWLPSMRHGDFTQLLVLIPMFAGPGTISALCLIGRREFQLFSFAIALNMAGFVGGSLVLLPRAAQIILLH